MDKYLSSINWEHLILAAFSCAMVILALLLFFLDWSLQRIRKRSIPGTLLRWLLLLPVGVTGIYVFIMHLFFPKESAALMNLPVSPFQYEVGLAYLCIGILGILSFRASYEFRLATVIAATFWMWGHAVYGIYHIIITSNIYLGSAVSWFWLYIILPFVLISCLKRSKPLVIETAPIDKP